MHKLSLITGADSRLFGNLCMLLQSMHEHDPDTPVHVCDFGFDAVHRDFLNALGLLLAKPDHLKDRRHPWYAKAAMVDFLPARPETDGSDGFVWIDADIVAERPVAAAIEALADDLLRTDCAAALCPDANGVDLDGFISDWEKRGEDLSAFKTLLSAHSVAGTAPYLNTGFVIVADLAIARAWRDLTLRQRDWLLFEQNCFNVLAHADPDRIRLLDTAEWNAHGPLLDTAGLNDDPVKLIHTTSNGERHVDGDIRYGLRGYATTGNLKLFLREDLRNRQLTLLQGFLDRHFDLLTETGVLTAPKP
ncbi:MAG: hypothetical protein RIM72_00980 [Alphaproteobacteria bacterium]